MTFISRKPTLLVLASTYPRWAHDPEPRFVHELSKRLTSQFGVIVLCPHAQGSLQAEHMDDVEVVRYRYAAERLETLVNDGGIIANLRRDKWKFFLIPGFVLAQAWAVWRLLRTRRIDVIHAHWLLPQGLIAAFFSMLRGRTVPYAVTSHGADLYALRGGMLNALKRFVIGRASAITVVSTAMLQGLSELGADTGRVSVQPMGVDMSMRFTPDPSVLRSGDEILFVGRLVEKKGLTHLIRALPEILSLRPDAYLSIAGFGPEESRLRAQVADLGLTGKVRFLGALPQSELPALYRRAAVFVAPFIRAKSGDQEGLPVAVMEAVACSCPLVIGDVPGIEDLVGEMKAQICVDACDTAALSAAVVLTLLDAPAAASRAQRLREVASKRMDWTPIAERYANTLAACL